MWRTGGLLDFSQRWAPSMRDTWYFHSTGIRGPHHPMLSLRRLSPLAPGWQDLARAAKNQCAVVVSSIFVNPAQFAAHEDFGSYPRQHEEDLQKLREAGVDMVFLPTKELMYPDGYDTYVACDVGSGRNEGAVRPHFFRGVATVCTKLFNIVRPDVVFFGQKDAQQCVVIEVHHHILKLTPGCQ